MISLTFPDGSARDFKPGVNRPRRCRADIQIARQEGRGDEARRQGRRPRRADQGRRRDQFVSRADPEALPMIRHDAAHVMAEAVQSLWPGAGDDRPGDRERLLLRLRQAGAVPPRRSRQDRGEDGARSSRKNAPFTKEVWSRSKGEGALRRARRELQGRARRRHPRGRGRQDLQAGRVARPLPRPAHGVDGPGRQGLQAAEDRRRLLARRLQQADAPAHLRHGLGDRRRARRLSAPARGGGEARPPQARPRDGPLPFPGGGAGLGVLAPQGLDAVPDADRLHAPAPRRPATTRSTLPT